MAKNPIAEAQKADAQRVNQLANNAAVNAHEDPTAPSGFATNEEALAAELRKLRETISRQGSQLEKITRIREGVTSGVVRIGYNPTDEPLASLWNLVYARAIDSIFQRGLTANSPKVMNSQLEEAVLRADEAVEAYIRVRKQFASPVDKILADWQKPQLSTPVEPDRLDNPNT